MSLPLLRAKTLDILKSEEKPPPSPWRWPSLSDRVTINGRTGSGKTVFGTWLLSNARFDLQPFVILNLKREELFRQIRRAIPIDISEGVPKKPGLYHAEPLPTEPDAIERWLWGVWNNGKTGLFIDEGYLMPDFGALKAILTTGRSLQIPVYTLSQRPVRLPRFVVSEADFYAMFHLNDDRDRKTVSEFTPKDHDVWADMERRLPPYQSRWYDVSQDFSCFLKPAPKIEAILERFEKRLTPRQTWL